MNRKEIEVIKEILFIAENNPGGYIDDIDESNDDIDDMTIYQASCIRKRCLKLLKVKP